jgi:hypothetical protein
MKQAALAKSKSDYYKLLASAGAAGDIDPATGADMSVFNQYISMALQQQSADLADTASLLSSAYPASKYSLNQGVVAGQASSGSEDYCELCQKQFCNKYYLKKHKMDVHGVDSTSTPPPQITPGAALKASANGLPGKAIPSPAANSLNGGASHHKLSSAQTISSILAVSALNNKNAVLTAATTASPNLSKDSLLNIISNISL